MSSSSSSGGGAYEPIDNISPGWNYLAVVRLGDNSNTGSIWEFCVGADVSTNCSTGNWTWDGNIADGIDSGWVDVSLTIQLSGGGSTGAVTVGTVGASYSQGAYTGITSVELQALAAGIHGRMQMRSISAVFSRTGGSSETVVVPDSSAPDGNNSTGSGTASQAIKITPYSDNYDSVTITAQVRLTSPATTLPPPDSLSAGIYVYTS